MSAKVVHNRRFFHLLRFLRMETIVKRVKRPGLSATGEQALKQYEQRLSIEEDLATATVRNYLSDLRHFAAWCESGSQVIRGVFCAVRMQLRRAPVWDGSAPSLIRPDTKIF